MMRRMKTKTLNSVERIKIMPGTSAPGAFDLSRFFGNIIVQCF